MRFQIPLLHTLTLILGSFALSGAASNEMKHPAIAYSFRLLAIGDGKWEDLYYIPQATDTPNVGRKFELLKFNHLRRSVKFLPYQGPQNIVFYRKKADTLIGQATFTPVAKAFVPEGISEVLFVFSRTKAPFKTKDHHTLDKFQPEFDVTCINDTASHFPEGHVLFLNRTSKTLYTEFGKYKLKLNPGTIGPLPIAEYYNTKIPVRILIDRGDHIKTVLKNQWAFSPGYRNIMVIQSPRQNESARLTVFRISEYVKDNTKFRAF